MMSQDRFWPCIVGLPFLAAACSSSADNQSSNGIMFVASGESLALTGYSFPPASANDVAFVDGWEVRFDRVLVTVDKIKLSANPDKVPGDPSQTDAVVAEIDMPFAVDLHKSDPNNIPGKGGAGEQAVVIAHLVDQNQNGGMPFATDGTRYGFGFDIVPATSAAFFVNLDAAAGTDYQEMIANQCAVLYVGTATFKGDKTDPNCYPADRKSFPDVVVFRLCFTTPTSYVNCQNPDNDPAASFPNEEHQRGIGFQPGKTTIAQITIHTDHPFWDSTIHDSPAHFDQYAARVVGSATVPPVVRLEDTRGVDYTRYVDAQGNPLDWRYCIEPPTDAHPKLTGAMAFDPQSVPHSTDPKAGLRDYYDFASYDQSTEGHLNSDGLCFVRRNYDSPP